MKHKSIVLLFAEQFVGSMQYILEICLIITIAVGDWSDFGVIAVFLLVICCRMKIDNLADQAILLINAVLGLHGELKARDELDKLIKSIAAVISVSRDGIFVSFYFSYLRAAVYAFSCSD